MNKIQISKSLHTMVIISHSPNCSLCSISQHPVGYPTIPSSLLPQCLSTCSFFKPMLEHSSLRFFSMTESFLPSGVTSSERCTQTRETLPTQQVSAHDLIYFPSEHLLQLSFIFSVCFSLLRCLSLSTRMAAKRAQGLSAAQSLTHTTLTDHIFCIN